MKFAVPIMLFVACILGIVALVVVTYDNPEYADGEPTAIVQDWLRKNQEVSSSTTPVTAPAEITLGGIKIEPANEDRGEVIWMEEYLGKGKWLVSKAELPSTYSETELTFDEWIAQTRGWDANRLQEYASDLSPEDREAFQEELRTYNPGQLPVDIFNEWYIYEHTGLVVEIQDE